MTTVSCLTTVQSKSNQSSETFECHDPGDVCQQRCRASFPVHSSVYVLIAKEDAEPLQLVSSSSSSLSVSVLHERSACNQGLGGKSPSSSPVGADLSSELSAVFIIQSKQHTIQVLSLYFCVCLCGCMCTHSRLYLFQLNLR